MIGWATAVVDRPSRNAPGKLLILGSLNRGWGVAMAFWFGTTNDSGRKTELLAQSTPVR